MVPSTHLWWMSPNVSIRSFSLCRVTRHKAQSATCSPSFSLSESLMLICKGKELWQSTLESALTRISYILLAKKVPANVHLNLLKQKLLLNMAPQKKVRQTNMWFCGQPVWCLYAKHGLTYKKGYIRRNRRNALLNLSHISWVISWGAFQSNISLSLQSVLVGISLAPQLCLANSNPLQAEDKKKIRCEKDSGLNLRYLWI